VINRPLMHSSITELGKMLDRFQNDSGKLFPILKELRHRHTPDATALRERLLQALALSDDPDALISLFEQELEQLFHASGSDVKALRKLAHELQRRHEIQRRAAAKETALRVHVEAALISSGAHHDAPLPGQHQQGKLRREKYHIFDCAKCAQKLRIPLKPGKIAYNCHTCQEEFTATYEGGIVRIVFQPFQTNRPPVTHEHDDRLNLENVYALFNASPATPWEQIELERRKLLHQYHPDKVAALGPKLQELAEQEGKRINTAYDFLRRHRGIG